jgi:hypothetical protein
MIENYFNGRVWETFMQNPDIQRGLQQAGFETITSINQHELQKPGEFVLYQNYPNPFNPSTTIRYYVPRTSKVIIKIFNVEGKKVATLVDATKSIGEHSISFDGNALGSGIYLCQLVVDNFTTTKKMLRVQ